MTDDYDEEVYINEKNSQDDEETDDDSMSIEEQAFKQGYDEAGYDGDKEEPSEDEEA